MPDGCCAILGPTAVVTVHGDILVLVFQLPGIKTFVVQKFGVVVAFVQVFKHGRKDFRRFLGEKDPLAGRFQVCAASDGGEEGRSGEDRGMSCKEAFGGTDGEGYYGRGKAAVGSMAMDVSVRFVVV